jgi:chemotaxis signal transduction protein
MNADMQNSAASFVLLQLGNRRFALPAGIVSELAPPVRLHTFPHKTPLVSGVIVRRGRIVPVYDAAAILLGRTCSVHRFYLIARRDFDGRSEASAIPVSGECELATAEMQPPSGDQAPFISGRIHIDGEPIDVLNFEVLAASTAGDRGSRTEARS